jgi:N-formylglutamate amidohydrolase
MADSKTNLWQTQSGDGPLIACAIHDGHAVRPEVAECLRLDDAQRRYEEDPYTGAWTTFASTQIIVRRSRFEFDLNRPRDKAVYITPADAWGLEVWRCTPSDRLIAESLRAYDAFYAHLRELLEKLVARHQRVVVFDLHSYNYVRGGIDGTAADPEQNPEINLGTGTMQRGHWSRIIERWLAEMRQYDYFGRGLDVRENIRFFGGQLPRWVHENFTTSACVLAIEVKKFFMNEWTGELDAAKHQSVGVALARAAAGVADELEQWKS